MLVHVKFNDEVFSHEFQEEDDFRKLFEFLEEKLTDPKLWTIKICDDTGVFFGRNDLVRETTLVDEDHLNARAEKTTGRDLKERELYLTIYDRQVYFGEYLDVTIEQILHIYGLTSYNIYPFPEHFLPVIKDTQTLTPFDIVSDSGDKYPISISVSNNTFKYLDDTIVKPSRFDFDRMARYTPRKSNEFIDFVSPLLKKTKSVISGSWILNDLVGFNEGSLKPDDVDIFSESLDLLVMICKKFERKAHQSSTSYNSSFMSYEISTRPLDYLPKINYIHVNADGLLTNDIESSSIERVLKFIKQRFDLSCCITSFDGEHVWYNSSACVREMDICGQITDFHVTKRICKYLERGFKICEVKHTKTCQRLYTYLGKEHEKEDKSPSSSLLYAIRNEAFEIANILLDIVEGTKDFDKFEIFKSFIHRIGGEHDFEVLEDIFQKFEFNHDQKLKLLHETMEYSRPYLFARLLKHTQLDREEELALAESAMNGDKCLFLLKMRDHGIDLASKELLFKYTKTYLDVNFQTCELSLRIFSGSHIPERIRSYHSGTTTRCMNRNIHA